MKEFIEKLIERLEEVYQAQKQEYIKFLNRDMNCILDRADIECARVSSMRKMLEIAKEFKNEYSANTPHKSAGGWIPVTERLPDNEYETVLAVSKQEDGYYYFVAVYTSKHGFRTEDCGVYEEPTAWLPLPELYEAEKPAEWKDAVMNHFTKIE